MREIGSPDHASTEQLSSLLDDRAEPGDRWFLSDHVDTCDRCSSELEGLRSVRSLLRAMPIHMPPRNFTIPIAVAAPQPRYRRLIPFTRALSALAAVLCVLFFSADAFILGPLTAKQYSEAAGSMQLHTTAVSGGQPVARSAAEAAAETRAASSSAREANAAADAAKVSEIAKPPEPPKPAPAASEAQAQSAARTVAPAAAAPPPPAPAAAAAPAPPAAAQAPAAGQAAPAAAAAKPAPPPAFQATAVPTFAAAGTTVPLQATQQPLPATAPPRATSVVVAAPPQAPAGTGSGLAPAVPGSTSDMPVRVAGIEVTPLRVGGAMLALIALVLLGWSVVLSRSGARS